jgi:hypothetical protein
MKLVTLISQKLNCRIEFKKVPLINDVVKSLVIARAEEGMSIRQIAQR